MSLRSDASLFTGRRILATNTLWSLAGQLLPAVVGIATIPAIMRGYGVERFGLLAIAWAIVGYVGLLDLGVGRAVTRSVATLAALPDRGRGRMPGLVWTANWLLLAIGISGGVLLALLAPWLAGSVFELSPELRIDARYTFFALAVAVPLVVVSTGVRGVLEALQRFGLVNAVRIPLGVLTFLVPLLALAYSRELWVAVALLAFCRLLALAAWTLLAARSLAIPLRFMAPVRMEGRELLRTGSWMTVSNLLSPFLLGADRLIIGAVITVEAVTWYATPYEAVTRLLVIPAAIAAVLFPAFATAHAVSRERLARLYNGGLKVVLGGILPFALVVVAFAPWLLGIWLGEPFPERSGAIARWLALGVIANALGHIPFALLQAVGRSDITARVHMAEVPAYLILLLVLLASAGVEGAAIAWFARATVDALVLGWFAMRELRTPPELLPAEGMRAAA